MNCRTILSAAILLLSFAMPLSSQQILKGRGAFKLDLDIAKFYGDETHTYVELYYGIREYMLTYKADNGSYSGGVEMELLIKSDSTPVDRKAWRVPHTVTDTSGLGAGKTMAGLESFALAAGQHQLTLITTDLIDSTRRDTFSMPLNIRLYPQTDEAVSDIELSSNITSSDQKDAIFYKNTLEVVPNASMLYGTGLPSLYYYCEEYNLTNPQHAGDVITRVTVTNGLGNEVFRKSTSKKRLHPSTVEYGKINIASYPGGAYLLHVTLADSLDHVFATSTKKFFVYRPGAVDSSAQTPSLASSDFRTSEYALKQEAELDKEYAEARYIASEAEKKQYEQLHDVDAKRKFLFNFWNARNPNPGSGKNDVKIEYFRRIEYATEHFGKVFREGWKTDRGRVYVIYGPTDEVEQFQSTSESNPYEIWHYNAIQGGVVFVFVDKNGMGQYQLVHSTHRDELHDENWYAEYAQRTQ